MAQSNTEQDPVIIVGGGLVGSLAAIYFAKRGYPVEVYERRTDSRKSTEYAGRSINLAISDRGLRALDIAGVKEEVIKNSIPMPGRIVHVGGKVMFQPYGTKEGQHIRSVSRKLLNDILMNKAEENPHVKFFFEHKCSRVDLVGGRVEFYVGQGQFKTVKGRLIVGADGAFSAVRAQMQKMDRFEFRQDYTNYGYKELHIPPKPDGSWAMDYNGLHIWPRGDFMMIALPNPERTFTCTLFMRYEHTEKSPGFDQLNTKEDVENFFSAQFPDAVPLMPTLTEDFFENKTSGLVTTRCYPFHYGDKVVLIGDAAHAIVPFYGQGVNCGFEDCFVLNGIFDKHHDNIGAAIAEFSRVRKPDADAIADLALYNFIEMRDLTASKVFQYRSKFEKKLHKWLPNTWIPLYTMVTFRPDMRYSEAMARWKKQNKILNTAFAAVGATILGAAAYVALRHRDSVSNAFSSLVDKVHTSIASAKK